LSYDTQSYEVYYTASSVNYKNNIINLERDFDDVLKLQSREFNFKSTNTLCIGYIAEEVYDINKDFAASGSDGNGEPTNICWFNVVLYQNEVIKRLDREVKEQNVEINKLKEILSRNNIN
jgi:hypothetical protein